MGIQVEIEAVVMVVELHIGVGLEREQEVGELLRHVVAVSMSLVT